MVKNTDGVMRAMVNKLERRDICFMDHKTNEKIAIDYELNMKIKKYYEDKLKEK